MNQQEFIEKLRLKHIYFDELNIGTRLRYNRLSLPIHCYENGYQESDCDILFNYSMDSVDRLDYVFTRLGGK